MTFPQVSVPRQFETPLLHTISVKGKTADALFQGSGWAELGFILEGGRGGWFDGRFSLFGGSPFAIFQSKGDRVEVHHGGRSFSTTGNALEILQEWLERFRPPFSSDAGRPSLPFSEGGAVGFFSYELAQKFEKFSPTAAEDGDLPDIFLLFINFFVLFDHARERAHLIYHPFPDIVLGKDPESAFKEGASRIEALTGVLENGAISKISPDNAGSIIPHVEIQADMSAERYIQMVIRAKEYISAGDIFQANLSHRFRASSSDISSWVVHQRLRRINPSPFSAYLNLGEIQIASASPERLVKIEGDHIETRPIAGTRPRGKNQTEEKAMVEALYASEKERAEHLMLVDLERNDLGKICRYGTVGVKKLMALEKYSHVIHLVSYIEGTLKSGIRLPEIIRAVFPGGTITGVPKIRCMEIISELEGRSRGIYTGSIGYIGFNGEIDLNIAIRTVVQRGKEFTLQVGAGIVADSDPESEYNETLQKAEAMFKALRKN